MIDRDVLKKGRKITAWAQVDGVEHKLIRTFCRIILIRAHCRRKMFLPFCLPIRLIRIIHIIRHSDYYYASSLDYLSLYSPASSASYYYSAASS